MQDLATSAAVVRDPDPAIFEADIARHADTSCSRREDQAGSVPEVRRTAKAGTADATQANGRNRAPRIGDARVWELGITGASFARAHGEGQTQNERRNAERARHAQEGCPALVLGGKVADDL